MPNNWLLNGNPAPATYSTGTVSTLALTPVCGSNPSNISVTVTVSGSGQYQSNTVVVTTSSPPTFSINGNNIICSAETYSIPNLPCGANIVWSATPSGLVNLSCTNCLQTTATLIGNPNANLFLTATITSCGVIQAPSKTIRCGAYPNYYGVISGPTYVGLNKTYTYFVDNTQYPGVVPVSWSWPSNWTYQSGGGTNNYVVLKSPSTTNPPTGNIVLNAQSCNTPFISSKF